MKITPGNLRLFKFVYIFFLATKDVTTLENSALSWLPWGRAMGRQLKMQRMHTCNDMVTKQDVAIPPALFLVSECAIKQLAIFLRPPDGKLVHCGR